MVMEKDTATEHRWILYQHQGDALNRPGPGIELRTPITNVLRDGEASVMVQHLYRDVWQISSSDWPPEDCILKRGFSAALACAERELAALANDLRRIALGYSEDSLPVSLAYYSYEEEVVARADAHLAICEAVAKRDWTEVPRDW